MNRPYPDINAINAHPRDGLLTFDEATHTYTHQGAVLESVTTLIEKFFPKFDAEYWAKRKAPSMGLTPEQLMAQWDENANRACELGTKMHAQIERYYLTGSSEGADSDAFPLFLQMTRKLRLYPYRTEWRIFNADWGLAGTLDFLERTPDGTFNIYDWKRSTKLVDKATNTLIAHNRYGQKASTPVSHLSDTSYSHYALQLSVYRLILETCYGIQVANQRLGVFHPDYNQPYIISLPYLKDEVIAILNHIKAI